MSISRFENASHDLGIDADKLRATAPIGTATPTATTASAGTVRQAAAVANAAGATPTKAEFDALLASLRAAGQLAV